MQKSGLVLGIGELEFSSGWDVPVGEKWIKGFD